MYGNRIFDFLLSAFAVVYGLAGPATFVYMIANVPHWTVLNAVPIVLLSAVSASFWWVYWPLHLLFAPFW